MEDVAYFGVVVLSLLASSLILFCVFGSLILNDDDGTHTIGMYLFLYLHGPLWIMFYCSFKWLLIVKPEIAKSMVIAFKQAF